MTVNTATERKVESADGDLQQLQAMIQGMTQRVDDLLRSLRPMEYVDCKTVNIDQAVSVSSTSEFHDLEIVIKSMMDKVDET